MSWLLGDLLLGSPRSVVLSEETAHCYRVNESLHVIQWCLSSSRLMIDFCIGSLSLANRNSGRDRRIRRAFSKHVQCKPQHTYYDKLLLAATLNFAAHFNEYLTRIWPRLGVLLLGWKMNAHYKSIKTRNWIIYFYILLVHLFSWFATCVYLFSCRFWFMLGMKYFSTTH